MNSISPVIIYEIHDTDRFPRVQGFASYDRLVGCGLKQERFLVSLEITR